MFTEQIGKAVYYSSLIKGDNSVVYRNDIFDASGKVKEVSIEYGQIDLVEKKQVTTKVTMSVDGKKFSVDGKSYNTDCSGSDAAECKAAKEKMSEAKSLGQELIDTRNSVNSINAAKLARDNAKGLDAIGGSVFKIYDIKIMASYARSYSSFAGLFMSRQALDEWRQGIDEAFAPLSPSGWAQESCKNELPPPESGGTAFVRLPDGAVSPSASVQAQCGELTSNFINQTQYLYRITARVKNLPGATYDYPMTFQIRLYSKDSSVDLLTQKVSVGPQDEAFVIDKSMQGQYSETKYEKICIEFDNPPRFLRGSTVCNRITCSTTVSTEVTSNVPEITPIPTPTSGTQITNPGGKICCNDI
jgi:hypothetical protein